MQRTYRTEARISSEPCEVAARATLLSANRHYLDALAVVYDPTPAIRELDKITERKRTANGKSVVPQSARP